MPASLPSLAAARFTNSERPFYPCLPFSLTTSHTPHAVTEAGQSIVCDRHTQLKALSSPSFCPSSLPPILERRGQTKGTTYTNKATKPYLTRFNIFRATICQCLQAASFFRPLMAARSGTSHEGICKNPTSDYGTTMSLIIEY